MEKKEVKTRKEWKEKQQDQTNTEEKPKRKSVRVRLFPIWLRIIVVLLLVMISALLGAAVGYGMIGDGEILDAFKTSTWTHILDLVNKK